MWLPAPKRTRQRLRPHVFQARIPDSIKVAIIVDYVSALVCQSCHSKSSLDLNLIVYIAYITSSYGRIGTE